MRWRRGAFAVVLWLVPTLGAAQENRAPPGVVMNVQTSEVERSNRFMQQVFALHEKLIAGRELRTETETGGYKRHPNFYKQVKYFDATSGRLLSKIQWEQAHPGRIHAIEVYVYGDDGRVVRDYSGWYLPDARNAPRQTWITLHAYRDDLHGTRQFDALDNVVFESCEGTFQGEKVSLNLDDVDVLRARSKPTGVMSMPLYKACFNGLPVDSAGKYLTPQ